MNPKKLARKVVPRPAVKLMEKSYREGRSQMWQARYGYPSRSLKMVAITGTNGKTTTASYVNSVLQAGGLKTAVYTTAYYEVAGKRVPNRSHMTVTSQRSVQDFFARAKKAGVDWVIMEVTSMALEQGRIGGLRPEIGIVTNLTQDHLDYHKTMQKYAEAKSLLFTKYRAGLAVLNHDDDWYEYFSSQAKASKQVSFGKNKEASLQLIKCTSSATGSKFSVKHDGKVVELETRLLGTFNVYNALAAFCVGVEAGLSTEEVITGIADLSAVPGRMEAIDEGQNFKVLVDFAYTPDALENALASLKPLTKGSLRIVFGATGDRDAGKRPAMGEAVAKYADAIYLTDDETYTEDPVKIRDAVYEGIKAAKGTGKTKVIDDRLDAIKQAFNDAKAGDTVLLAGIGHEDYRNMGGKKQPWDEREIARKSLS
jgi:UDP-N-acetylmuramoyl-L-alanyl-D-glutamate--2,6-diaminopimelate ligase